MPRGGKRSGAGRKKGFRFGTFSPSEPINIKIAFDGNPINFFKAIMSDERLPYTHRYRAAVRLLPYTNSKVKAKPVEIKSDVDLDEVLERIKRRAAERESSNQAISANPKLSD